MAPLLYSESEFDLRIHQSGVMCAGRCIQWHLALLLNSQSVMKTKWIQAEKEKNLYGKKKQAWKEQKTLNRHNKVNKSIKSKEQQLSKKSAIEGCQSKQSLRDVQQRKNSASVLSLRQIQFFGGNNKRTKTLNKLLILGNVGDITEEQVGRMAKAPLVTHSEFYKWKEKNELKREILSHLCFCALIFFNIFKPSFRIKNWKEGMPKHV